MLFNTTISLEKKRKITIKKILREILLDIIKDVKDDHERVSHCFCIFKQLKKKSF